MKIAGAYSLVVFIWSTTPLAIHWSNSSFTFVTAITLRMVIALAVCYSILLLMRKPLVQNKSDWRVFSLSALGLFPNMLLVYWAAQYIPSGLMSIIMGVYPFLVGLFSWLFFNEKTFTPAKIVAVCIAIMGLGVIHFGQLNVGVNAVLGVGAMVLVCVMWGISSVWVKRLGQDVEPLRQGTGSLLVASPFFAVAWFFMDGQIPDSVDVKSAVGVGYLVLAGSVVGHTLFFYILRKCAVVTVSLITLLSPLLAVTWGVLIEGESFTVQTLVGGSCILISLAVFQGIHKSAYCYVLFLYEKLGLCIRRAVNNSVVNQTVANPVAAASTVVNQVVNPTVVHQDAAKQKLP